MRTLLTYLHPRSTNTVTMTYIYISEDTSNAMNIVPRFVQATDQIFDTFYFLAKGNDDDETTLKKLRKTLEGAWQENPELTGLQLCTLGLQVKTVGLKFLRVVRYHLREKRIAPPADFTVMWSLEAMDSPPDVQAFMADWIKELGETCYSPSFPDRRAEFEDYLSKLELLQRILGNFFVSG